MTKKRGISREVALHRALTEYISKEDIDNRNNINNQASEDQSQKQIQMVTFGSNINFNINIDSGMTSDKLRELLNVVRNCGF
jgi:hypothetical protein